MNELKKQVEAGINNLYRRYKDYDADGTKYNFEIRYTTLTNKNGCIKGKRQSGADTFHNHIKDLIDNYTGVTAITVTDFAGINAKAKILNHPVTIELESTPHVVLHPQPQTPGHNPHTEILQGLSGLFAGTEFEGLGNLAPLAKFIDDKHSLERLREKNEAQQNCITELQGKNAVLEGRCNALERSKELLQNQADDLSDQLDDYQVRDKKQDRVMSVIGLAGASVAKTFLRQYPGILSAIIPAEQLSGILNDQEVENIPDTGEQLSEQQQAQLEDATTVFEWLQSLDKPEFDQVISIIATIRQHPEYTTHIINYLQGGKP